MRVGVLGSGQVGQVLARAFADRGHDVMLGSRDPRKEEVAAWLAGKGEGIAGGTFAETASHGDLLVLAVLGAAVEEAIGEATPESLAGKVVIDATNHFQGDRPDFPSLSHHVQSITGGPVAKAFNLNFASIHEKASAEGTPPGSFYCANDAARDVTEQLIRDAGYSPVNAGGLDSARSLEDALPLVFAVSQGSGGPFFYRVGLPGEL